MPGDLLHFLQSLLLPRGPAAADERAWQPAVDLYRTRDGWLAKFDLAGVRPEDVRVAVEGRRLMVSGVRRDCAVEEGCRCYRMEIAYSRFERSIELPDAFDAGDVATEYRDGMLLVRIQIRP